MLFVFDGKSDKSPPLNFRGGENDALENPDIITVKEPGQTEKHNMTHNGVAML